MVKSSNLYYYILICIIIYIFSTYSSAQSLEGKTYNSNYAIDHGESNYHRIYHLYLNFKKDYVTIFCFLTDYFYGENNEEKWNKSYMNIPTDAILNYKYTYKNDTLRIINKVIESKNIYPNLYTSKPIFSWGSYYMLPFDFSDEVSEPLYVINDSIKFGKRNVNYIALKKTSNQTINNGNQYISSSLKGFLSKKKKFKYKLSGRFINNEFLLDSILINEKFRKKYNQEINKVFSQNIQRKFTFIEKENYLIIEYLYTKGILKIKRKKLVGKDISFYKL
ncbi:hypothetical protein EI427_12830 [Flammeovirga pectinis]|uniref:Uncharacterized protein n=1 Tax=Flammeovirga pectinis TaxID=2494373 RepID=A0A3Q9FME2_9BACT|nr:hypothetical protein [Flammeovirga pectinis]AZQ63089.1 hypothetical protein EI427_12830 [Flammeovirga pectinis]